MADYIDREELRDKIYELMNPDSSDVVQQIYAQPSVDAVEVVRCKDCKFYLNQHDGHPCCDLHLDFWVDEDDYCKWGEKE